MPSFVMICSDKPNALALRMATRERHLAYAKAHAHLIRSGGPLLDENGDMNGSLILMEADDIAAVRAFNTGDPYTLAGLFERVEIRPYRFTIGASPTPPAT